MTDISGFMTWFLQQTVRLFTFTYTTLNNITFGGTSLLKVIIFINIIVPFLYVIITIPNGAGSIVGDKAIKTRDKIRKSNSDIANANARDWYYANWREPF